MFLGIDLENLVEAAGYVGLFAILFAESGLFVGFFLPGDSLLFTAGFLASQGFLNIFILMIVCFVAAALGDNFGYYFGKKVGPALFAKEKSFLFKKEYVEKAKIFFEAHGSKTIVFARFVPIVRTFAPILAGVGQMHYATFLVYNLIGAFLWGAGVTLLGYFLGKTVPNTGEYLLPIILVILFVSFLPSIYHVIKNRGTLAKK